MTLSTIRSLITSFATYDLDLYDGASPTSTQLTELVNKAIRTFSSYTWCNYDPKITLTLATNDEQLNLRDTTTPKVSRKVIMPRRVTINSTVLTDKYGNYGLWTLADLDECYPGWQTYTAGQPVRAVLLPNNKLLLSPKADQAYSNSYISGVYLAANMTVTTDDNNSPDIPEEFHEILAYIAAFYGSMPNAAENEAWNRLGQYNSTWREAVENERRNNRNKLLGSMKRGQSPDWMSDTFWV